MPVYSRLFICIVALLPYAWVMNPASAWEPSLGGENSRRYQALGQLGPMGFFGPANVDQFAGNDVPRDDFAPVYGPPPPPPSKESPERPASDLRLRDEVEASALEFARNFSNVQHVKICYSKLYGGWYLFLYIVKGKKRSLQHYSRNPRSAEWEIIETFKEDRIPKIQWKLHLKGELPGEKCYILK